MDRGGALRLGGRAVADWRPAPCCLRRCSLATLVTRGAPVDDHLGLHALGRQDRCGTGLGSRIRASSGATASSTRR
ncbi:MAG: hypothetical protein MZW92_68230 [Comamonadaceae bacterium]|nr:hypothetical protein [Comamonadaceae bacterium]